MKHVVFDFDGVICNSALELLYNALSGFREFYPTATLFDGRTFCLSEENMLHFSRHPDFKRFTEYIPFARNGMDLSAGLEDLMHGRTADDRERFFAFADADPAKLKSYHDLFYATRTQTMAEQYDDWFQLLELMPEMDWIIQSFAAREDCRLYLSTTKSADAISSLLSRYELADCFARVLTQEDLVESKVDHFELLMAGTDEADKWYFIEDSLKNIELVRAHYGDRVEPIFVEWGYASAEEKVRVLERGIALVKITHHLLDVTGFGREAAPACGSYFL